MPEFLASIEQKKRAEIEQLRQLKKAEAASAAAATAPPPPTSTGTNGDAAHANGASDAAQADGTMAAPQAESSAAQNGATGKDERSPTESNAPSEGSAGGDGGGSTVSLKERETQFFSSTVPLSMICKYCSKHFCRILSKLFRLKPYQPDYRPEPIPPPPTQVSRFRSCAAMLSHRSPSFFPLSLTGSTFFPLQIKFNIYRKRPMPELDEPTPMDTSHPPTVAPTPEVAAKRPPAAPRRQISGEPLYSIH